RARAAAGALGTRGSLARESVEEERLIDRDLLLLPRRLCPGTAPLADEPTDLHRREKDERWYEHHCAPLRRVCPAEQLTHPGVHVEHDTAHVGPRRRIGVRLVVRVALRDDVLLHHGLAVLAEHGLHATRRVVLLEHGERREVDDAVGHELVRGRGVERGDLVDAQLGRVGDPLDDHGVARVEVRLHRPRGHEQDALVVEVVPQRDRERGRERRDAHRDDRPARGGHDARGARLPPTAPGPGGRWRLPTVRGPLSRRHRQGLLAVCSAWKVKLRPALAPWTSSPASLLNLSPTQSVSLAPEASSRSPSFSPCVASPIQCWPLPRTPEPSSTPALTFPAAQFAALTRSSTE